MDPVFRALSVYIFLMVVFRAFGKRSLAQITMFDFAMLLIIAETTQQALLGQDFSLTNCFLLVTTLVVTDTALSLVKRRWPWFDRLSEGVPLIILEDGKPFEDRMRRARVDVGDILSAARELQGLERLDQIRYAVLEKNGSITIIPAKP